jgi:hypothetical protein
MNGRVVLVALVVAALVIVGLIGRHIETDGNTPPTTTTQPGWVENVLADTSAQQTFLDGLNADIQQPDLHAVTADCHTMQQDLAAWKADEAGITDLAIRTTYTNVILKLGQSLTACDTLDLATLTDLSDSADTFLNATINATEQRYPGG